MARVIIAVGAVFALQFSVGAQELKPFDRLSKNYITLDAELGAAGAQPVSQGSGSQVSVPSNAAGQGNSKGQTTGSASTTKDYDSVKQVVIKTPVAKNLDGMTIEAYGVYKDYDTKQVRFEKIPVQIVSRQEYRFTLAAQKTIERVKYKATVMDQFGNNTPTTVDTGRAVNHGEKIAGWFARAIFQSEIIGVVGSSPQWQQAAGQPGPVPDGKEK